MTTAECITSLRNRLKDSADSNFIRQENLTPQVIAAATTFYCDGFRQELGGLIVAAPTVTAAGVTKTATLVNASMGSFSLAAVPATPLLASYFWQFFSDTEYEQFIEDALAVFNSYTAVADVPGALRQALIYYALSMAYDALAHRAVMLIDEKNEPVEVKPGTVAKKWQDAAKEAFAKAQKIHEQYNRGMFTQLRPVGIAHLSNLGNQAWTPQR